MRNKVSNLVLGLVFIVVGIGFFGKVAFDWDFNLFFDGWWTLFIIIPCVYSMINNGINVGNVIGVGVGAMLLLSAQDIVGYKIIGPVIFILLGLVIIFKGFKGENLQNVAKFKNENRQNATAVFGGSQPNFDNIEFHGINCSATFGGVDLNLRRAIINEDCVINCNAIFGGIDILLPPNVKVKLSATPILGGTDNKFSSSPDANAPTVYINATCIFGGLDIK